MCQVLRRLRALSGSLLKAGCLRTESLGILDRLRSLCQLREEAWCRPCLLWLHLRRGHSSGLGLDRRLGLKRRQRCWRRLRGRSGRRRGLKRSLQQRQIGHRSCERLLSRGLSGSR